MRIMKSCEAQKSVNMTLIINGVVDWRTLFPNGVDLSHGGLGKFEAESGLRKVAEINGMSFEATLVGELVWMGCELLELEVETNNHPEWGKMIWIPDHPSYAEPPKNDFEAMFKKMDFYRAMFMTEKAGVQHYCLFSTAINGRFHGSFTYHRVVLNPPKPKNT